MCFFSFIYFRIYLKTYACFFTPDITKFGWEGAAWVEKTELQAENLHTPFANAFLEEQKDRSSEAPRTSPESNSGPYGLMKQYLETIQKHQESGYNKLAGSLGFPR